MFTQGYSLVASLLDADLVMGSCSWAVSAGCPRGSKMGACRSWVFAIVAMVVYVGSVDAGVTIETVKEGDGVNFPTVGKSIKV